MCPEWLSVKFTGKYINFPSFYSLKSHHVHNWILQFQFTDGSEDEEYKEDLIQFESIPIDISDITGYWYVSSVSLMSIYVKYNI